LFKHHHQNAVVVSVKWKKKHKRDNVAYMRLMWKCIGRSTDKYGYAKAEQSMCLSHWKKTWFDTVQVPLSQFI